MSFVVAYHTGGASGSPELPGSTVNATTSFFERLGAGTATQSKSRPHLIDFTRAGPEFICLLVKIPSPDGRGNFRARDQQCCRPGGHFLGAAAGFGGGAGDDDGLVVDVVDARANSLFRGAI